MPFNTLKYSFFSLILKHFFYESKNSSFIGYGTRRGIMPDRA